MLDDDFEGTNLAEMMMIQGCFFIDNPSSFACSFFYQKVH